ncbi:MAG: hypothetical protein KGJ86_12500, partial [Chloroflexota bacterium]|nr:hypothetical protein [Chloroflexota bacterium]
MQIVVIQALSYLVGMLLPGERALLMGFDLTFADAGTGLDGALEYEASVVRLDDRLNVVELDAAFQVAGQAFATARVRAFMMREA